MTDGITMTNAIIESLVSRSTTSLYDPAVTLTDDQIQRAGANRHHRADVLPLAELALHRRYARRKPRLGCVRSPGINPRSPLQPSPSSSAASCPITG